MNLKLSFESFLADPVLGWAAFRDADAAGPRDPGARGEDRPSQGRDLESDAALGGETEDGRSKGKRFPYSG